MALKIFSSDVFVPYKGDIKDKDKCYILIEDDGKPSLMLSNSMAEYYKNRGKKVKGPYKYEDLQQKKKELMDSWNKKKNK